MSSYGITPSIKSNLVDIVKIIKSGTHTIHRPYPFICVPHSNKVNDTIVTRYSDTHYVIDVDDELLKYNKYNNENAIIIYIYRLSGLTFGAKSNNSFYYPSNYRVNIARDFILTSPRTYIGENEYKKILVQSEDLSHLLNNSYFSHIFSFGMVNIFNNFTYSLENNRIKIYYEDLFGGTIFSNSTGGKWIDETRHDVSLFVVSANKDKYGLSVSNIQVNNAINHQYASSHFSAQIGLKSLHTVTRFMLQNNSSDFNDNIIRQANSNKYIKIVSNLKTYDIYYEPSDVFVPYSVHNNIATSSIKGDYIAYDTSAYTIKEN